MSTRKYSPALMILLLLSILLFSCNEKLSRSEAEKQIILKMQYPDDEMRNITLKERKKHLAWVVENKKPKFYRNYEYPKSHDLSTLENENLVTVTSYREDGKPNFEMSRSSYSSNEYYIASFTEKAKPFVNGNGLSVKIATIKFGEVTGIIERNELKIAEVNYTTKRDNISPFGKAFNVTEETFNHSVIFIKYDDGWRIK